MANTENFDKVIAFIKANPEKFDMKHWANWDYSSLETDDPPCGSVMCMGGTCAYFIIKETGVRPLPNEPMDVNLHGITIYKIAKWLDISIESAIHLFYMKTFHDWYRYGIYFRVTAPIALSVLEVVRDTGHCSEETWRRVAPQVIRTDGDYTP